MKNNIKDIISNEVINTVKNHIESFIYNRVTYRDIDDALKYNFNDDVIEYCMNNGILKKLYMIDYKVKKL